MHFSTSFTMFDQPIAVVRDVARRIDAAQRCSAGVISRDLSIPLASIIRPTSG